MKPASFLAAALLAMAFANLSSAQGDAPQPKEKDTSARFRPQQAELAATVVPGTAKPGDVVELQVKAKLQPGYHIYKLDKTQPEEGPRSTELDLFNTAGLKTIGDWKAVKEPIRKKEPVFPNLDVVEFYEDEAVWSIKLQVPNDAAAGQRDLQVQAYFQICNASTCSRPGRWTLNPASLKIEGGKSAPASAKASSPSANANANAAATPKGEAQEKDSDPQFRPPQAKFATTVTPAEAKPGEIVVMEVEATLEPGWHIYELNPRDFAGPHTELEAFDTGGLQPLGEWVALPEPIRKKDPVLFPDQEFVGWHEDKVVWSLRLQVPADAKPGGRQLKVQAYYQVCDANQCTRPGRWTLPAASLIVMDVPAASAPKSISAASPSPNPNPQANLAPSLKSDKPETAPPSASAAPSAEIASSAERKLEEGIGPFLLLAIGGGLLTLAMPCVWPMIPITVNFFVKQNAKSKGTATKLAMAYCLTIIGIFTGFSLVIALAFGPGQLNKIANSPLLNLFIAAMFVIFGLSLLGLFEVRLPSRLLNASAQGESRGGLIGVMFMALTLTITSFTCTMPVVGALIVIFAQGKSFFYPILGMLVYSSVVALPFFALALAPGLLSKMPKSGDWMNTVKVVGGLIELGAALKFINNAEQVWVADPSLYWFDSQVLLSAWVILSAICGVYLLGVIRTEHDHQETKIGAGRMIAGAFFLGAALYVSPALFGNPPKSYLYQKTVLGFLPIDQDDLVSVNRGGGAAEHQTKATSNDPDLAQRQQTSFHGVPWGMSYEAAIEKAMAEKKLILADFTGVNCSNCRLMEQEVFPRPEVAAELAQFVTVQLYVDISPIPTLSQAERKAIADKNFELEVALTNDTSMPLYAVIDPATKQAVGSVVGYQYAATFVEFLRSARVKHSNIVAQK